MNNGGDVLARGGRTAQFSAGGGAITEIEHDLSLNPEIVGTKYGLSEAEIITLQERREKGEKLEDIQPVDQESMDSGLKVIDRRTAFSSPKPVAQAEKKFKDKQYSEPSTILDRVLVKRIPEDPEFERMEDGSLRNKRTGFVIPAAYRQHNNIGIVLVVGQFVSIGGLRIPMKDIVHPGDRVTFGDYNTEVYKQSPEKTKKLCDAVEMNYEADEEGLRIVRVQDIRVIERPVEDSNG
jgi:co-chaperonin GroES (HSP10)